MPSCDGPLFIDTIAAGGWVDIDVTPGEGTRGIRNAIYRARDNHPNSPVRIRLAPGTYADSFGSELWVQRVLRPASAPIWIVATNPAPNATVLGHGLNFVGVSYFAFEGLTFGPASVGAWNGSTHANPQPLQAQAGIHISGTAKDGGRSARRGDGTLDPTIYGQFEPSHHIIVRRVTVQHLFNARARDAVSDEGQSMDGMKFNQAEDVWVLDSNVNQTSRHGIDNVGVHRAAFCGNVISHTGGGLGIEAKGGSVAILYEGNVLYDVRRFELGGEDTDAVYYYSVDGAYTYEAKQVVARNNLIVDAREAALEFSGCADCAMVGNTVLYSSDYVVPGLAQGNVRGGDALRAHASTLLGGAGAGNDCMSWNATTRDYDYFSSCWGVGSRAPAPVGRSLKSTNLRVYNNAFLSAKGTWKALPGQSTIPCPLNLSGGTAASALAFDGNYWWNGGATLAGSSNGCLTLAEGPRSTYSVTSPTPNANVSSTSVDPSSFASLRSSAAAGLTPKAGSPLLGAALLSVPEGAPYDFLRRARPSAWAIGALEAP